MDPSAQLSPTFSLPASDDDGGEDGRRQRRPLSPAPDDDGAGRSRAAITLIDHTDGNPSEHSGGLWARSARVVDYIIISGSRTRAGAYVAWNCEIITFEVRLLPGGVHGC